MSRTAILSLGVFLLVASIYVAVSPGRIDMVDGQYRYEVTRNLLRSRSLQIRDPYLIGASEGIGGRYSPYGIAGSLVPMPLVVAATWLYGPSVDREQFFFSFTSPLFGAATAAILLIFYTTLGVSPGAALRWTLVASLATLAFPAATTVFDQTQHGFFILSAALLAFLGARRDSLPLTIAGGLALAVLVNFQETYAILFPALGLITLMRPDGSIELSRRTIVRCAAFVLVGALGLIVWAALNYVRFGAPLVTGKGTNHPTPFGNPLLGLLALLISPGKSIFLYSPPIVLALIGVGELMRRERTLGLAIVGASLTHLALISCLSFFGGDWCWGPRYFVPILPLLALGFPHLGRATTGHRAVVPAIVAAGIAVQVLAVSLDHHRFFYARSLPAFFWHGNEGFYFRESALLARPGEILDSIEHGMPAEADAFRPGPYQGLLTYAVFGPGRRDPDASAWMRHYRVFWLPRPWPLWMRAVASVKRPIPIETTGIVFFVGVMSLVFIRSGLRRDAAPVRPHFASGLPSEAP